LGMDGFSGFTEGDYLRTAEGLFFAVKGGVHPDDMVVAYLRYIPDPSGDRLHGGVRYRRVSDIEETTRYLEVNHPRYLNHVDRLNAILQTVPHSQISAVYKPRERLREILEGPATRLEKTLARFVETLSSMSGVSTGSFGVSGSLLIGLVNEGSDVDINVYGSDEGRSVYEALGKLRRSVGWVSPYDDETVKGVLFSRWGDLGLLKELAEVEKRKVLHGLVLGTDYFVRLLRDEASLPSKPMGSVTLKARVSDSSGSIYTPCTYMIDEVEVLSEPVPGEVSELMSYRGKFTEQARSGDRVKVRGALEEVQGPDGTRFRVVLGGREDYMLPMFLDNF
jgi:predicted nucleotidyltransferase